MNSSNCLYIVLTVAVCLCSRGSAYPQRAPKEACRSMIPDHTGESRTTAPPYTITVSALSGDYQPNQLINVTIIADAGVVFKGFLLQARGTGNQRNKLIGAFIEPPRRSLTELACDNKALSHRYARERTTVTGTWKAPYTPMGPIVFQATIVQSFNTFWVGVTSMPLQPRPRPYFFMTRNAS